MLRILTALFMFFFCNGCLNNHKNIITLSYDNFYLKGTTSHSIEDFGSNISDVEISIVHFGYPKINCDTAITELPEIYIELGNHSKHYLPDLLNEDYIKKLKCQSYKNKGSMECYEWNTLYRLDNRGEAIYDSNGKLMVFESSYPYFSQKSKRSIFWDSNLNKRYIMPLKNNEVIELFGNPKDIKVHRNIQN